MRSLIWMRSLGVGKLGWGCGRFVVSERCLEGDEERIGNGDGVGSEGAELMARDVGISLDWGAFFIVGCQKEPSSIE